MKSLLACGWGLLIGLVATSAWAQSGRAETYRGFVSEDALPGLFMFRSCRGRQLSTTVFGIDDKSPSAALFAGISEARTPRATPGGPVYVEFQADAAGKILAVRRFLRAVGYAESCGDAPTAGPADAAVVAEGTSPAWKLVASPAGARLEIQGEPPVRFDAAPFAGATPSGGQRVIDAWSRLDGGTIRLELLEQMCGRRDAETAFGARVTLRFGSRQLEGCAARF